MQDEQDLTDEQVADISTDQDLELYFYKLLAGTTKVEVIPIPDDDGNVLTPKEIKLIKEECKKQKIKILYRISHGNVATVFDPVKKLTGVVPDNSTRGFYC